MVASESVDPQVRDEIAQLVYTSLLRLDAKDFVGWLELCTPDFTYAIRTWSPELRREMTLLEHDLAGLTLLVRQLPRHNSDQAAFSRHATVYTVDPSDEGDSFSTVTAVTIYRTELDGGETELFAVGRYYDCVAHTADGWRLAARELRLGTRSLGIGTHYPL